MSSTIPQVTPATNAPNSAPSEAAEEVNLDSESVAGEEDPGASLDMTIWAENSPAKGPISTPPGSLSPGDATAAGTPGAGAGICRECGGSGRVGDSVCPSCKGGGKVAGVGGA
ncbi:MAG: hypothetical protein ABJA84_06460 [Polaromonas sp.]